MNNCLAVAADDGAVKEFKLWAQAAAVDPHPLDLHSWPVGQGDLVRIDNRGLYEQVYGRRNA